MSKTYHELVSENALLHWKLEQYERDLAQLDVCIAFKRWEDAKVILQFARRMFPSASQKEVA